MDGQDLLVEFLDIIEKLAHPEKFGGNKKDSFDVIVPSLPGFGFSSKPQNPLVQEKWLKYLTNS